MYLIVYRIYSGLWSGHISSDTQHCCPVRYNWCPDRCGIRVHLLAGHCVGVRLLREEAGLRNRNRRVRLRPRNIYHGTRNSPVKYENIFEVA